MPAKIIWPQSGLGLRGPWLLTVLPISQCSHMMEKALFLGANTKYYKGVFLAFVPITWDFDVATHIKGSTILNLSSSQVEKCISCPAWREKGYFSKKKIQLPLVAIGRIHSSWEQPTCQLPMTPNGTCVGEKGSDDFHYWRILAKASRKITWRSDFRRRKW